MQLVAMGQCLGASHPGSPWVSVRQRPPRVWSYERPGRDRDVNVRSCFCSKTFERSLHAAKEEQGKEAISEAPTNFGPKDITIMSELPDVILGLIYGQLPDRASKRAMRGTCRSWRASPEIAAQIHRLR